MYQVSLYLYLCRWCVQCFPRLIPPAAAAPQPEYKHWTSAAPPSAPRTQVDIPVDIPRYCRYSLLSRLAIRGRAAGLAFVHVGGGWSVLFRSHLPAGAPVCCHPATAPHCPSLRGCCCCGHDTAASCCSLETANTKLWLCRYV